ncbi:phage terminase large subunit [Agrobacterium rhizogenes]|nr:phage terminase large subunit [Rhizobium rhizogenes]
MQLSRQAAASELLRRKAARNSLTSYAKYIEVPGAPADEQDEDTENFLPVETTLAEHHTLILEAADRCIAKRYGRLMIFMPPGSAKSTYGSVVVPSYAMGKKPGYRVIAASYGEDLARKMGRRTRSVVRQRAFQSVFGTTISKDVSAANEWTLENGSEYMSGGILSGITGNRANLVVIDDPIKGRRDADSEAVRKSTLDAYEDDLKTRLLPGGSIILIQTRWNEGDLAGCILPENYAGESGMIMCRDGQEWEVICLPAKAERADDPLGRKPGEYLWPEWFDRKHWAQFERNPRTWSALYQQRPAPEEGDYFKREWIRTIPRLPPRTSLNVYGASDYAVTGDGGDFTVHIVIGIDPDGRIYLLDMWRGQTTSDVWIETFCDLVLKWKPIGWAEETGQIKSGVGPHLTTRQRKRKAFVYREAFPTRGDKAVRAQSIRGRMALDGLYIAADAPFLAEFMRELLTFPAGVHDDQVDALGLVGQLLEKMWTPSKPKAEEPAQKHQDYTPRNGDTDAGDWMTY